MFFLLIEWDVSAFFYVCLTTCTSRSSKNIQQRNNRRRVEVEELHLRRSLVYTRQRSA